MAGPSLLELRNQEYKLKSDALDKLVLKKLLETPRTYHTSRQEPSD